MANVNPFRTAVSFWGQSTQISSTLSPHRDCGSKRVNVVDRWEEGTPTPIPLDAKVRAHSGGKISDLNIFATVYVDDYFLIRVYHSDYGKAALITSDSLASDHVRVFGPGEEGVSPILAPKKSTNRDSTIDALGALSVRTSLRISFPRERANDSKCCCLTSGL